jgi:cytochrome c55X
MTGRRRVVALSAASLAGYLLGGLYARGAPAESAPAVVRSQVEAGKALFATSCANCHGSGGKGAIGPPLVDRNLPLALLRTTILDGRVGTPMPPFRDALDEPSQAEIIAYALWLSSGGRLPDEPITIDKAGASAAHPSANPVAIGSDNGIPARGAQLFFDPTQLTSCRVCHSYANKGGPVGPDLLGAGKTPAEVYRSISRPKMPAAGFPAIALELRDGTRMLGIESEDTADALVWFDVSALPPVKRTTPKSDLANVASIKDAGIYDHTALPLSKQDRLDLSAYLGTTNTASPAH